MENIHSVCGGSHLTTPALDDSSPSVSSPLPSANSIVSYPLKAAEDDPLPAIEGLQISGEAFPGREIIACGFGINGTTTCRFAWLRYSEDGSMKYIEGAQQATYQVTEDDVNSLLAVEVLPIDNRERKGEAVQVFANEKKKITHGKPSNYASRASSGSLIQNSDYKQWYETTMEKDVSGFP